MKVRIRGNSVRFRLGRSEVDRYLREGKIAETTRFPSPASSTLIYELLATDVAEVKCAFDDARLTVRIPRDVVRAWANGPEVSIRAAQPIDAELELKILIEKDFECLDGSSEDCQADAYPNPRKRPS